MYVVWTSEAIARLEDIETYIAQDSPENAKEMVARLLTRARQLETAALSGREVPEYRREDIRELLERSVPHHLPGHARARHDPLGDALPSVAPTQSTRPATCSQELSYRTRRADQAAVEKTKESER